MEEVIIIYLDGKDCCFRFSNSNDKDSKIFLSEMEFHSLKGWLKSSDPVHEVKAGENRTIILYKNKIKYASIMEY